ncbi:TetR family transcriptional regulator [Microbispora corallina]|uniref:TetR family transcriptional regulator n=1 Tax=Microbispora corallina TaxID=83302 RepID=A0ABQ4G437_9ACTN|nr:TetR family transcriptional regulator [Microbispora corallina]GIH41811.1 TetR family transcriptional regulator [Microbispora corallina]
MEPGLRERKKLKTRRHLYDVAIRLFLERGFDAVSVAEIAEEAGVSKMTVFNYFPAKEDIVAGPMEEHADEPARVVRDRPPGETVVGALRTHFLAALAGRDPVTGLNDVRRLIEVRRMMTESPALLRRVLAFRARREELLRDVLASETGAAPGDLTPKVAAAVITGVLDALTMDNFQRIADGASADELYASAVRAAEHAFGLLENGLGDYGRR